MLFANVGRAISEKLVRGLNSEESVSILEYVCGICVPCQFSLIIGLKLTQDFISNKKILRR